MISDDTFQALLFDGLDDEHALICREWVDESKKLYNVKTDQEVIAAFTDTKIIPHLASAATLFKNKSIMYCEIIGMPTPRFEMFVTEIEGRPTIIIHEGFLQLFQFLNEVQYSHEIPYMMWDYLNEEELKDIREALTNIEMASMRIVTEFLEKPFRLPSFHNKFVDEMQWTLNDEFISMLAFSVYHEIGHCELGHHFSSSNDSDTPSVLFYDHETINTMTQQLGRAHGQSDRYHYTFSTEDINGSSPQLKHEEQLNLFKKQEFEADEYAIRSVGENRQSFYSGAFLFLNHLSFIELALQQEKKTHPIAINRMSHLEKTCLSLFSDDLKMSISGMKEEMFRKFEIVRDNQADHLYSMEIKKLVPIDEYIQYLTSWTDYFLQLGKPEA